MAGVRALWDRSRFPTLVWLVSRVVLSLASELALRFYPHPDPTRTIAILEHEEFLRPYPAIDGFCRWDCGWFWRIASHGYKSHVEANVWPLYPVLARALHEITRLHVILCLVIVANVSCLIAWNLLHRLFVRLEGRDAANWGLVLFAAYPFAFFQAAAYSESTAILFSVLAVALALEQKPIRAGIALGVGTLARHTVMIGGIALLVAQARAKGWRLFVSRGFLGLVIPWVLVALFPLWLSHSRIHDPWAFVTVRSEEWGADAWLPVWTPFLNGQVTRDYRMWVYPLVATIPVIGTWLLAGAKRWKLFSLAALQLAVFFVIGAAGLGRYTAECWPAFLPLGVVLARKTAWRVPLVGAIALAQVAFFVLFVEQYPIL